MTYNLIYLFIFVFVEMRSRERVSVLPTSGALPEKRGAPSFFSALNARGTDQERCVSKELPSAAPNKIRGGRDCSGRGSDSVDSESVQSAAKKHRIQKSGTSSSASLHHREEREKDRREERLTHKDRKENNLMDSSYSGGVEVAIRVRPLVRNEVSAGENLCAAVFSAENRTAHQRVRSIETIPLWNASNRAQRETIGGPHTTLRLLQRILPRAIGVERSVLHAVASPTRSALPAPQAQTRESWWSQHLMTTSTVSSSACTSNEHIVRDFHFPIVLGPNASQRDVYDHLRITRYCNAAYAGKAAAVLCFGQTGSGKTYTISGARAVETVEPVIAPDDKSGSAAHHDTLQTDATLAAGTAYDTKEPRESRESADDSDGVQYRAVSFFMGKRLEMAKRAGKQVRIQASYVEVYNEKVNDLLQGRNNLTLHYHKRAQLFFLEGLMMVDCENESDVRLVLKEGQRHRQRAAHMLNDNSSRSHTIFTLYVEVKDPEAGKDSTRHVGSEIFDEVDSDDSCDEEGEGNEQITSTHGSSSNRRNRKKKKNKGSSSTTVNGKLSFVDLAGAERLKETQSEGEDAKSINKSLFALGSVLEKLSQQQQQQKSDPVSEHFGVKESALRVVAASTANTSASSSSSSSSSFIPYRSSVLTKLLMDTLSGTNCSQLLFIACITPGERFYMESIKTLYYAQRASDAIRAPPPSATVGAGGKMSAESLHIFQLTQRVQALEKENRIFREALRLPIRGVLGEDNIRRQVHQLIQQRGTTRSVASVSTASWKQGPSRTVIAVSNEGEDEAPSACDKAVDTAAQVNEAAISDPFFTAPLSSSFSSPPSSAFSAADSAVAAGARLPTRKAPSYSSSASTFLLLERKNRRGDVSSPSPLSAPTPYASSAIPTADPLQNMCVVSHEPKRHSSWDVPSPPLKDVFTRVDVVEEHHKPQPIPIRPAVSVEKRKERSDSSSECRKGVEVVVEMDPDSDEERAANEEEGEKGKVRGVRGISDANYGRMKTDYRLSSGTSSYLPQVPHENDNSSVESIYSPLPSSALLSSSLIGAVEVGPCPTALSSPPVPFRSCTRMDKSTSNEPNYGSLPPLRSSSCTFMPPSSSSLQDNRFSALHPILARQAKGGGQNTSLKESISISPGGGTSSSPPNRNALGTSGGFESVGRTRRECTRSEKNVRRNNSEMSRRQNCNTSRDVLLPFTGESHRCSLLPTPSHHPSASITGAVCCRGSTAEGRKTVEQKFANRSALPPPPSALVAKAPGGRSAMDILNDLPDR